MYKHVRDSIFPDKTPNFQSTNSANVDIIRAVDLLYIKKNQEILDLDFLILLFDWLCLSKMGIKFIWIQTKVNKKSNEAIFNLSSVYLSNFTGKHVLPLSLHRLWLTDFKSMYYILISCLSEFILIFFSLASSKSGRFTEPKNVRVNMFSGSNFFSVLKWCGFFF